MSNWGLLPGHRLGTTVRRVGADRLMVRSLYSHREPLASDEVRAALTSCFHRRYPMLAHVRLEHVWGGRRFAIYYLACIAGAGVCQLLVGAWTLGQGGEAYPTVGASGGVLGLVLAYGLIFPQQKVMIFPIPFFIPARIAVVLIGAFALFAGVTGTMPSIAHFAHLGGMLTGWLLIAYWRGQPPFGGGGRRRPHLRSV